MTTLDMLKVILRHLYSKVNDSDPNIAHASTELLLETILEIEDRILLREELNHLLTRREPSEGEALAVQEL